MPDPRMKQRNQSGYIEAMQNRPDPYGIYRLDGTGVQPNQSYPDPADYGYADNEAMAIIKALFADPMDAHAGMSAVYANRDKKRKEYEAMMEQARAMAENARLARQYGQQPSAPSPTPSPTQTPIGDLGRGVEALRTPGPGVEEEYRRLMNGG